MEKSQSPFWRSPFFWGRTLLVLGMLITGAILYPMLPAQIPTHWGLDGSANGWSSKLVGVWIAPGISMLLLFLFPLLRRADPFRERYAQFAKTLDVLQFLLVAFFAF